MPPHIQSGTPNRKNRSCPWPGCEARPRKSAGLQLHMQTEHGVTDMFKWWQECFEAHRAGFRS